MTLEELKEMRDRCAEVQNTLRKDIAYIHNSNQKEEHIFSDCWEEYVAKIRELFEFMPKVDDISCYCSSGRTTQIFHLGAYEYPKLEVRCTYGSGERGIVLYYSTLNDDSVYIEVWEHRVMIGQRYSGCKELVFKDNQSKVLRLMQYRDRLYEMAKNMIAECQQKVTEGLIHRNEQELDYAEKIKNYR